ncbi:hypothetical protein M758_6G125000 [Ceratodon purpureus]|uniref:Uncharacterized protein n=1 Tax=Ceratodon purpureus TaxID=3225 RepID=A0A8T0HEH2_CERPU|nr:hypothetical protein KC19_6G130100 [Ceratodon purpureus]KAG0613722.1 hypothetical protein M758_6G125000 [Ceratodon purpureus]
MTIKKSLSCLVLAVILIRLSNLGSANAAKALYAFGDSFVDTGNSGSGAYPYGKTWPGYPAGRASDGRVQVDYFAELFGVPSPTASLLLKNNSESLSGVNFAKGGAGVTYAYGMTPLDRQVNELESLVEKNVLSKSHLRKSVALVSLGVNDYSAYNAYQSSKKSEYASEVESTVTTIVDGIALNLVRLYGFGFRNVVIANLANMVCSPHITVAANFSSCSSNSTLEYESSTHNELLQQRVRLLNHELQGANFIIVDQSKAFEHLFYNGAQYGFENPLVPCCTWYNDSAGQTQYTLCQHPEKAVIFDGIHPTQAAWKVVINLYASVRGYTQEGPNLNAWIQRNKV